MESDEKEAKRMRMFRKVWDAKLEPQYEFSMNTLAATLIMLEEKGHLKKPAEKIFDETLAEIKEILARG